MHPLKTIKSAKSFDSALHSSFSSNRRGYSLHVFLQNIYSLKIKYKRGLVNWIIIHRLAEILHMILHLIMSSIHTEHYEKQGIMDQILKHMLGKNGQNTKFSVSFCNLRMIILSFYCLSCAFKLGKVYIICCCSYLLMEWIFAYSVTCKFMVDENC